MVEDQVVIAPSECEPDDAEVRTITGVSGFLIMTMLSVISLHPPPLNLIVLSLMNTISRVNHLLVIPLLAIELNT